MMMMMMMINLGRYLAYDIHQDDIIFVQSALLLFLLYFDFSSVSASLPKTEANWEDVKCDLEKIEKLIQSVHFDATLYTESDAHPNCKVTAMNCFILELSVISHESRNMEIDETVENLIILAKSSLSSNGNTTESGCKECEELEEKNIKEFLRSFSHIVQMFIHYPS
ncbi:interleukin-15 isoform X2 [Echinops telfairi]|uniref:Interleukin-15 isoform X2 n=1 Tax=Echinops telfairi TaxID=9371 RepID=A0AC55DCL4_ECHTE|nr:interleukin-15 isoform X2 [Echinops telfairi]